MGISDVIEDLTIPTDEMKISEIEVTIWKLLRSDKILISQT